MRGRLTRWSPEVGARVCAAYAAGESITRLCREPGAPSETYLRIWLRERADLRAMWDEATAARTALFLERPELAKAAGAGGAGRPSTYSEEMAAQICARIAAGDSLWGLAQDRDLPATSTLYDWLETHEDFRRMYRAAHDVRASAIEEEVIQIADDDEEDVLEGADGRPWANHQAVRRCRLMMDARRWKVARLESRTVLAGPGRRTAAEPAPKSEAEMTYAERLALLD